MLSWLKSLPGRAGLTEKAASAVLSPTHQDIPGYHLPQTQDALTTAPARQIYLQQLWDNCALPAEQYQTLYFTPLAQLLARVQNVPATSSGPWSGSGGYGDMVVRYVTCAVRLAKAHLLPPGAAPEEQAAQGVLWNAVVYWSALFYHLPLLSQLTGELRSGEPWLPGTSVPLEPYRFRFNPTPPRANVVQSAATLMACQLLPRRATGWLSTVPATLDCLAQHLCGLPSPLPVIDELLATAAEKSGAVILPVTPQSLVSSPEATALMPFIGTEPAISAGRDTIAPADPLPGAMALHSALAADEILPSADEVISHDGTGGIISEVTPAPDDDMQALLALLGNDADAAEPDEPTAEVIPPCGADEPVPGPAHQPAPCASVSLVASEHDNSQASVVTVQKGEPFVAGYSNDLVQEGEVFWKWLRNGVRNGSLPVNGPDDALQVVAGFVLLPVPGLFYRYLKEAGHDSEKRESVQQAFERLNFHRRQDNRRYFFARIYATEDQQGSFRQVKGYLVKASQLFNPVPQDSCYLMIS
ncbi:TraI domain-containing protein [Cedecea neteri]|nr:TraI domain-containing protein [Cedecea neteri]